MCTVKNILIHLINALFAGIVIQDHPWFVRIRWNNLIAGVGRTQQDDNFLPLRNIHVRRNYFIFVVMSKFCRWNWTLLLPQFLTLMEPNRLIRIVRRRVR